MSGYLNLSFSFRELQWDSTKTHKYRCKTKIHDPFPQAEGRRSATRFSLVMQISEKVTSRIRTILLYPINRTMTRFPTLSLVYDVLAFMTLGVVCERHGPVSTGTGPDLILDPSRTRCNRPPRSVRSDGLVWMAAGDIT
jgi:hypothetical protein